MEISNKTLASLLVLAIVVSVAGTFLSLSRSSRSGITGYYVSNDTGTTSVNVGSITSLRFDVNAINFGSGSVNSTGGFTNCTMFINGTGSTTITQTGCTGFNTTNLAGDFVLENAGTTYINVTMNSSANSSTFIGGGGAGFDNPVFKFTITNNETGSCLITVNYPSWSDSNLIFGNQSQICGNLSPIDTVDTLQIGVYVAIPLNSLTGSRTATFLAQGTG